MTGILGIMLAGGLKPVVDLPSSITPSVIGSAPQFVGFSLLRNGTYTVFENFSTVASGYWVTVGGAAPPSDIGDLYDVKYDYSGDSLDGGSPADDTYVQINATRTFTLTADPSSKSNSGTVFVRRRADGSITPPGGDTAATSLTATII